MLLLDAAIQGPWAYLFGGFIFLFIALISREQFIKRLRFFVFIDIQSISHSTRIYGVFLEVVCYSLALLLIVKAVSINIEIDRNIFWTLAVLGGVLILVRIFAVTFGNISVIGFELIVDQAKLRQISLLRSPLIVGGTVLILLFGVVPFLTDRRMLMGVEKEQLLQHVQRVKEANKEREREEYITRTLLAETKGETDSQRFLEESFFHNLTEQANQHYIISGKAGIGKTWFLRQLSIRVREIEATQFILDYNAGKLAQAIRKTEKVEDFINKELFGPGSWYSMPLTRKIMKNSVILVDGFDEVEIAKQPIVAKQLQKLAGEYPDAAIVVTTRPGALGSIPAFMKLSLEEFSITQYKKSIKPIRMKKLKKQLDMELNKGASLDLHFLTLLGYEKSTIPKELSEKEIETHFTKFLENYKFDTPIGGHYVFMSTFRDMAIIEELFVAVLTGGIINEAALKGAGRKSICEQFLLQRIIRNCRASEKNPLIAKKAIELLTEIADDTYWSEKGMEKGITKFYFDEKLFSNKFQNITLGNFLMESELILEDKIDKKCYYVFDNITIDSYFISTVLFKKIQTDPSQTKEILAVYKDRPEIVSFFIAQFDRAEEILGSYLTLLVGNVNTEIKIGRHLEERFPELLMYLDRSEANIKYLKKLPQSREVQSLPEDAQQVVKKAIDDYVAGL